MNSSYTFNNICDNKNGIPLKLLKLQAGTWLYFGVYSTSVFFFLCIYIALVKLWIKVYFSHKFLLKYLSSLLVITAVIFLKMSLVCNYQVWFNEKFNIPTVLLLKNDDVIKMCHAQYFLLILFEELYMSENAFSCWNNGQCMILKCWVMNVCKIHLKKWIIWMFSSVFFQSCYFLLGSQWSCNFIKFLFTVSSY